MLGLMQQQPLLISSLLAHAARHHADAEVVSATGEGGTHHSTWGETERRARRLVRALQGLGVEAAGPRRHARLERLPPSRDLLRDVRHGGDLPHDQSAPVA